MEVGRGGLGVRSRPPLTCPHALSTTMAELLCLRQMRGDGLAMRVTASACPCGAQSFARGAQCLHSFTRVRSCVPPAWLCTGRAGRLRRQQRTDATHNRRHTVDQRRPVDPSTVRLPVGGTQSATVTITCGGGFTGNVVLSTSGVPAGVTVTFGTATLGAGVTTTTVNFAVGSGATQTTLPVQVLVIASGSGVPAMSIVFQFSVIAAPSPSATPSVSGGLTATLQAKDTTSALIATVTRNGGFTLFDAGLTDSGTFKGASISSSSPLP